MKIKDAVFPVICTKPEDKCLSVTVFAVKLLTFLMLFTLSAAAQAQDYTYTVSSTATAIITGYNGAGGDVTIPAKIGDLSVTGIADGAFSDCTSLTSITIPDSITSIGSGVFYGCTNLISVSIPSKVVSIGDSVFFDCTSLLSVTISAQIGSVPNYAFSFCTSLTNVALPSSVSAIGEGAFDHCASLASLSLSNILTISNWAFSGCTNLQNITIPNSVISLGESAFEECTSLTSISIPSRVRNFGNFVFYNCTGLTNLSIPSNFANIGYAAFAECTGLSSVIISNGVASIGDYVFYDCTNLTSVTIPESVTQIGDEAFANCTGLSNVTIPGGATSIGSYAFYNCTGLTNMFIPSGITDIPYAAFSGCSGLTSVALPARLLTIEQYAFADCTNLTGITIPDGVQTIEDTAFYDCTGLTSVTIPAKTTSIGSYSFSGCTGLTAITVSSQNRSYSTVDGVLFNKNHSILIQFPNGITGSYTIPSSVKSIAAGAFFATSLTSITVPASVTSVGDDAFSEGAGLTRIVFQAKPPVLGQSVFDGDYDLTVYYYYGVKGWASTFGGYPTVAIDGQRPTLTLLSPKAGIHVSNTTYQLIATGRSADNIAMSNVLFRVGDGPWTSAVTSDGWTNWSATLLLAQGANKLQVYAEDSTGNCSPTASVSFVYIPLTPLTIGTTGLGKFTPACTNGQLLVLGASYTLTATGIGGNVFSNWTGSYYSDASALKFTMQSNTVLLANFIPNPFASIAGSYSGLFTNESGVTAANSGAFSATVKNNGVYSGKLFQGTKSYPLSGRLQFSISGMATNTVKINKTNLTVILSLTPDNGGQINGTVGSDAWASDLSAIRNPYSAASKTPDAGRYTLVVPGVADNTDILPAGESAVSVGVNPLGTVTVSGFAADGNVIGCSSMLSQEGRWPLYAPLSGGGFLIGWETLSSTNASPVEGSVNWIKPAGAKLYPQGFNYEATNVYGSVYTNQIPLLDLTNGVMTLTDGNLPGWMTNYLSLAKLKVTDLTKTNTLKMTLTPATGLFSGSILNQSTRKAMAFKGVLLQNENAGFGAFQGSNQTGEVIVEAQ